MRILKTPNTLHIFFSDGTSGRINDYKQEDYDLIVMYFEENKEQEIKDFLFPQLKEKIETLNTIRESKFLQEENGLIKLKQISEVSIPKFLIDEFLIAEKDSNQDRLESLTNFWKLCSLNPDEKARENMLWFLQKYGFNIGRSGLFETFRHVKVKSKRNYRNEGLNNFVQEQFTRLKRNKKSPKNYFVIKGENTDYVLTTKKEGLNTSYGNLAELYLTSNEIIETIYTDNYSGTFDIRIGKPVVMDRKKCNSDQNAVCSSGLHVAASDWLMNNNFGEVTLRCLVNPVDVVAVPPQDSYGKMRTCCYFPIEVVDPNNTQRIDLTQFENQFLDLINYSGEINNKDEGNYKLQIPSVIDGYALIKTISLNKTV